MYFVLKILKILHPVGILIQRYDNDVRIHELEINFNICDK